MPPVEGGKLRLPQSLNDSCRRSAPRTRLVFSLAGSTPNVAWLFSGAAGANKMRQPRGLVRSQGQALAHDLSQGQTLLLGDCLQACEQLLGRSDRDAFDNRIMR